MIKIRKLTKKNKDTFFEQCTLGEMFTCADNITKHELFETAKKGGVELFYFNLSSVEYQEYGPATFKITSIT